MSKITQRERVGQYLKDMGSITGWEAVKELGCMRLSNRISELEEEGWVIDRLNLKGKNRYGDTVTYMRYYFVSAPQPMETKYDEHRQGMMI